MDIHIEISILCNDGLLKYSIFGIKLDKNLKYRYQYIPIMFND